MSYAASNQFVNRNHPNQIALRGALPEVDDRGTPRSVYEPLQEEFRFTVDTAARAHNALCERYFTDDESDPAAAGFDGLAQSWAGESVWCNPPYSNIRDWVQKAWDEHRGVTRAVLLLPANRTEQLWWQDLVEPFRDRPGSELRTRYLKGRVSFTRMGHVIKGHVPFGSCLLIWPGVAI